jgi:hypothetical protein
LGKIRRGGYVFISRKGDHDPKHVHIFKDGREIAKWNLRDWVIMKRRMNRKLHLLLLELMSEKKV